MMVSEGLCNILWTIYFVWIGRNAFYFVYFTIGLNVLTLIGCLYIVESPRYLYGMERFDECRQAMISIAYRNGVTDYQEPLFLDEQVILIENEDGDVIDRIAP
jgi:hypothetical protein